MGEKESVEPWITDYSEEQKLLLCFRHETWVNVETGSLNKKQKPSWVTDLSLPDKHNMQPQMN